MDIVAYESFNQGVGINNQAVVAVQLTLPQGVYVLSAKMEFVNTDGDPQNASAVLLVNHGAQQIEQATIRLGGLEDSNQQCVSLLTVWTCQQEDVVKVTCSTYRGSANWIRLVATRVDKIQVQH